MLTSIDREKAFDKIQYSLMTKYLMKLGLKENFLSLIRFIYENLTHINGENKYFSLKFETK